MSVFRYVHMSAVPSEAGRGFGSPVAGVIDSWGSSDVVLSTEVGSPERAPLHPSSLQPQPELFFWMPNLPFSLQGMGWETSIMSILFLCYRTRQLGFPREKQIGDANSGNILQK